MIHTGKEDSMNENSSLVGQDQLVDVLKDIIHEATQRGLIRDIGEVVLVGGSALCARQIREHSLDIDLYAPARLLPLIAEIEEKWKPVFGEDFFIDVSTDEYMFGRIRVKDPASEGSAFSLDYEGVRFDVRALTPETLFILKAEASREKDIQDLALISKHTSPERILDRFAIMARDNPVYEMRSLASTVLGEIQANYGIPVSSVWVDRMKFPSKIRAEVLEDFGLDGTTPVQSVRDDSREDLDESHGMTL